MKVMKRLNEREIIRVFQKEKFIPEDVEIFHLGKQLCATSIDTVSYTHLTLPTRDLV